MPLGIRQATADRVEHLAGVLGRALASEPMIAWPFRGELDPEPDRAATLFRILLERYVEAGVVWEDALGRGCAAWIPPGRLDIFETTDVLARETIGPVTDDGGARYDIFWEWIGGHFPDEQVWFLDMVGVDPAHQGAGIGSALIRFGLERADADRAPRRFLETGNAQERPVLRAVRVPRDRRRGRAGRRPPRVVHAPRALTFGCSTSDRS